MICLDSFNRYELQLINKGMDGTTTFANIERDAVQKVLAQTVDALDTMPWAEDVDHKNDYSAWWSITQGINYLHLAFPGWSVAIPQHNVASLVEGLTFWLGFDWDENADQWEPFLVGGITNEGL